MHLILGSVGVLLPLSLILLLDKAPVASSTYVPVRCNCMNLMKQTRGPPLDFSVSEKNAHCHTDEILVKVRGNDKLLCLSPTGRQGKRLLRCWRRVNSQGKDKKQCLRTRKNRRNRQNRKNQRKTKKATS
ncbi:C-X-C motif chemokine 9 [Alosa sapidissima]|uniref:C-X-C motif chemokine 9 n=1 Tax=Alosa sapidissima TaxID=34773 RepID=UPI001C0A1557|nr:C-X-C motif chemokine 9 [Alosa sapidissima]